MAYAKRRLTADGRIRFTAVYLDPAERERSAGTFDAKRIAERAARAAEQAVRDGGWIDPSDGKMRFREYVEQHWWPSRHLELSTRAAYRSYLDRHFIPYFGEKPMSAILPSTVQSWVTSACAAGLAPRSVVKYHVMLHSIFKRAVRDRVIARNPCTETELPKVVAKRLRILSPEEFDRLLGFMPARYLQMVLTEIETGLRWGELIALRPQDIDFLRRVISVDRVVVEVSRKISPTGERMVFKDYPKDNEPRSVRVSQELIQTLSLHMQTLALQVDDLLFSSTGRPGGRPISRNTFRTRIWLPALEKAQLGFHVRFHDLRHAHASWALAGGADLKAVMDRLGHAQISTTQRYLHTLPESDEQALAAFGRTRTRSTAKH
ncbi:MAG: tyrosine-type recombinase/integrase [Acidothermaceae bacterium]